MAIVGFIYFVLFFFYSQGLCPKGIYIFCYIVTKSKLVRKGGLLFFYYEMYSVS